MTCDVQVRDYLGIGDRSGHVGLDFVSYPVRHKVLITAYNIAGLTSGKTWCTSSINRQAGFLIQPC